MFALPLFGSSLIQQLYNTVDLMFVGRLLGKEASAAVGAGSLLLTCMLGFFTGLGVGVGVVTAKAYGAGKQEELKKIVHTAAGLSLLGAVAFMAVGWCFAPVFLRWLHTPEDILQLAAVYMRIYFLSLPSIVGYNISAGILRALGNSRTPMLCQFFGGLANVAGNACFMYLLHMGVQGAALATLCSQSVAAVLTIRHLGRLPEEYRLRISGIRIDPGISRQIVAVGIPAAVQSMVITLSNLLVQSRINSLGVDSIAAFTAYFKVENFIYLPILALGQACSTFTSQNLGAGKQDRVKKGSGISLALGVGVTAVISGSLLLFSAQAFGLFAKDREIIALGGQIARVTFPFYFIYVFLEVYSSVIRGAGKALPSMLIIVGNMCVVRIAALQVMMHVFHSAAGVAAIYPITWICASLCLFAYYRSGRWYV